MCPPHTNAASQSAAERLEALRKLAIREHFHCEDPWHSCPKAEGGCANEACGDECNCGAEEHNAEVEKVFAGVMGHNGEVTDALVTLKKLARPVLERAEDWFSDLGGNPAEDDQFTALRSALNALKSE